MPYYEYECACGQKLVEKYSMDKVPQDTKCPKCRGKAVRKFSPLNFQWGKGMKELK